MDQLTLRPADRCTVSGASVQPLSGLIEQMDGSALIEAAIVLPCFSLLVFGLFWFVIVLFGFSNVTYASRAAVRYASLSSSSSVSPCTSASLKALVAPYIWAATPGNVTVTPTWSSTNTVGNTVQVTATIIYKTGIPYSSLKSITVSSSARRIIVR